MDDARRLAAQQAEIAARSSYGRLLSMLAARCGDIAGAEDALADAFAAALRQWPRDGVPANPLGWLLTVARRGIGRHVDRQRDGVLSAIYAAYGVAWEDIGGADTTLTGLCAEAIWSARLLTSLAPADPEAKGLLSMMLHCEARRPARRNSVGDFVPLSRQDPQTWSRPMAVEAEALLRTASAPAMPGRFQTEAAIQSLHAHQRMTGVTLTEPLARLYDVLARFAPTTGVLVARAVAHAENGDPAAGCGELEAIEGAAGYQPWWAGRARVAWLAGDAAGAWAAARTAAGLSTDPSVRRFLLEGGFR